MVPSVEFDEIRTKNEILEKKVRGLMQFLEEERLKNYNLETRLRGLPDQS